MDVLPDPTHDPAVFSHPLRVYWEDTDAGGVVFYANYLKFFERARTEWLRTLGFSQQQLLDRQGLMFVVAEAALHCRRAARLDDWLRVTVQLQDARRASLRIAQQAWRDDILLAEGEIRIGCVHRSAHPIEAGGTFIPCRIPENIMKSIR